MNKTKELAMMGEFIALGVVFNIASFPRVPFFGTISFVYFFCFLSGILFGPLKGGIIAAAADVIQALAFPKGIFIWQITASNVLLAVIMGLVFMFLSKRIGAMWLKLLIGGAISYVLCTLLLNSWGLAVYYFDYLPTAQEWGAKLGISSPFLMLVVYRAATQWLWIALNCVILALFYARMKPIFIKEGFMLYDMPRTVYTAANVPSSVFTTADEGADHTVAEDNKNEQAQ